jgi:flagellar motor protein MotB
MYRVAATASRPARTTNARFFSSVRLPNALHKHLLSTLNAIFNPSKTTQLTSSPSQTLRQAENNNNSGIAGAAVKGIEKAGEMAQKVKEATGLGTGQAQGKANEVTGQASGKANELAGQAQGKAAELEGKAKGAFEQGKGKAGVQ